MVKQPIWTPVSATYLSLEYTQVNIPAQPVCLSSDGYIEMIQWSSISLSLSELWTRLSASWWQLSYTREESLEWPTADESKDSSTLLNYP